MPFIETRRKLTCFGPYCELLGYDYFLSPRVQKEGSAHIENLELKKQNSILSSIRRARRNFKMLVYSNHQQYGEPTLFLTLTHQKIFSLSESYSHLKYFFKRINKSLTLKQQKPEVNGLKAIKDRSLKYVNVTEYQQRGSPHFHILLFNLPYIQNNQKFFHKYWGPDRLMIKPVTDINYGINYISKYISKQFSDDRFVGRKRFTSSNGLKQPIVIQDDAVIQMFKWSLDNYKIKENIINTSFPGEIHQTLYNFPYSNVIELPGLVREAKNHLLDNRLVVA